MHIKKFTANTVKDAMKAIKSELGDGALIMGNKKLPNGLYELTAAVDYDAEPAPQPAPVIAAAVNPFAAYGVTVRPKAEPKKSAKTDQGPEVPVKQEAGSFSELNELRTTLRREIGELKELKEFYASVISQARTPASEVYSRLEEEFVGNGVDRRLAHKILMSAFNGAGGERSSDIGFLKSFMKERIAQKIKVKDPVSERAIVTFVGPTGVGKTTTIAKVAAVESLKRKRKVALITTDTFRIAAAEQLKVYGRIMGLPVEVARDSKELSSFIGLHGDKDLILIDTAGRGNGNAEHLRELREIAAISPSIRFNLVLSSQSRDESLYDSVRGFGTLPIDTLTFTKLDEGPVCGQMLNTMLFARKPVAFLTTGQRVPEDIERATKERLLNFIMPN